MAHSNIEGIQKMFQGLVHLICIPFLRIFFKYTVSGEKDAFKALVEAQNQGKGLLFAPNHISEWDAVLVRCALPLSAYKYPMYYVAMTKDHYQYAKFGWRRYFYGGNIFKMLGAYPAYLGMRDYSASLVNHIELLEHGKAICIFPEGKISVNTSERQEAKGGIGYLVDATSTDVIPVQFSGLKKITWSNIWKLKRPEISVVYKSILRADALIASADEAHVSGPDRYKHIAHTILQKTL